MKDISKSSEVLWIDEKGIGPAELATVTRVLYDGKTAYAYEVERSDGRPAAVFRALDVLEVTGLPPGLVPLLTRLGAFKSIVSGAEGGVKALSVGARQPSGLETLEALAEEANAAGKTLLTLDVTLPPDLVAMGPQKIVGTKFLAPDRQEIGLVSIITPEGKARVIVPPQNEARVRELIASKAMPEISISGEVTV